MADAGVLLLVHGEVTDADVDMFDREAVFIRTKLVRGRVTGAMD
jgi:dihydroorotase